MEIATEIGGFLSLLSSSFLFSERPGGFKKKVQEGTVANSEKSYNQATQNGVGAGSELENDSYHGPQPGG